MSKDKQAQQDTQSKPRVNKSVQDELKGMETAVINPIHSLQRAHTNPRTLSSADAQTLQRTIGNQALGRLIIQRKMTLGPVGDKYEQEADAVAKQVVGKLQAPQMQTTSAETTQRQEEEDLQMKPLIQRQEEEELQMKPLPRISSLQRQEEEELQMKPLVQRQEEEELQMKSLSATPSLQRQEEEELQMKAIQRQEEEELQAKGDPMLAGGELSGDIESSVQSAKSSGQPMSDNIRVPMEQAFNADFSNVKVHTGNQADTLNRSLSARAFTSGQDVFFRNGEYNPGSSTGQELIAHELTHTIQQGTAPIQRHSDSALKKQIDAAQEEELIQTKRVHLQRKSEIVQRHPIKPSMEVGHEATFGERKTGEMKSIASASDFIIKVRNALKSLVTQMGLADSEEEKKLKQINEVQWEFNDNVSPANPAQVKDGEISIFYYHPNYYHPNGSPRTEFIKSTVLHEGLHFVSHDHQGFQAAAPLNTHSTSSLAGADSLDEAVTDKIGAELAEDVLESTEAYTTNYWNLEARRGLDFHMTLEGLENLAAGEPKLWLGKMVDIILEKTGLEWSVLKRAYVSDDKIENEKVIKKLDSVRGEIGAAWKLKSEEALLEQLGEHAIPKDRWEVILNASVEEVEKEHKDAVKALSKADIKTQLDAKIRAQTTTPHEIVSKHDARSSSLDDWKAVRTKIGRGGSVAKWDEAISETKWGGGKTPSTRSQEGEKDNPYTEEYKGESIPDIKLKGFVNQAYRLLNMKPDEYPLGWVIIPSDKTPLPADTLFSNYPAQSVTLLQSHNKSQSLSSLAGVSPTKSARGAVDEMGGGGYEANGEFAVLNIEHVNFATVVHEMGHHKQNKDLGFNEQTIMQVKGTRKLLDFHNILYSENKIAARGLSYGDRATPEQKNPYVRLRYTSEPTRLKLNQWIEVAKGMSSESENYKRLKERLLYKGGKYAELITAIEQELANDAALYPPKVALLFKNYMADEIAKQTPSLVVEEMDRAK